MRLINRLIAFSILLVCMSPVLAEGRAAIKVRGLTIPHSLFAIYVMPAESVPIEALDTRGKLSLKAEKGKVENFDDGWVWVAPTRPGLYKLSIGVAGVDLFTLNAFVMKPATYLDDDELDGYEIGEYPDEPLNGDEAYYPPRGFVPVLPQYMDVMLSPSFRLKPFRCKQPSEVNGYAVLSEKLLLKLELILEKLRERGIQATTLHVRSGYRTPEYNDDIGHGEYSRHIYGDAADIFVDENPRNRRMDDLNGDGKVNFRDARWLGRLIDEIDQDPAYRHLWGGLGVYTSGDYSGPFVHVDTRGFRTRWEN